MAEFPKYFRIDVSGPDKEGHVNATITPAADVQPVVRGKWNRLELCNKWQCSECGVLLSGIDGTPQENCLNFCPNCGADMRGGEKR